MPSLPRERRRGRSFLLPSRGLSVLSVVVVTTLLPRSATADFTPMMPNLFFFEEGLHLPVGVNLGLFYYLGDYWEETEESDRSTDESARDHTHFGPEASLLYCTRNVAIGGFAFATFAREELRYALGARGGWNMTGVLWNLELGYFGIAPWEHRYRNGLLLGFLGEFKMLSLYTRWGLHFDRGDFATGSFQLGMVLKWPFRLSGDAS